MPTASLARRCAPSQALLLLCGVVIALVLALGAAAQNGSSTFYQQDTINPGLDALAEKELNRTNPRQSLRGFLDAIDKGNTALAAHSLNLSGLDPARQAEQGPDLARRLASVIARQVWIDWSDLSARPDALMEIASDTHPRAGQPRRDLRIATLQANGATYDIRLARYKAPGLAPVWLFTPQTVANIGPLYDRFGPRPYERLIPNSLKREFARLWLWEWIVLPVMAALVTVLGWGTRSLVIALAARSPREWWRSGLQRSAVPLALLVMAGAAQMILSWVLTFSGPVHAILRPTLTVLMVWAIGIAMLRVLDAVLNRITLRYIGEIDDKRGVDERELYTSIYALRRLIVLVMVVAAAVIILARLDLFDSIGMTLLASAGVVTVILGIAGQAVLGNILASLQIAFAKPVRIGDSVLFEGDWAYVESIFYTFLRLRTWDHRRIVVPVTYFVSKPFENWSVAEARMMKVITLRLDFQADVDLLRRTFAKLVDDHPDIAETDNSFTYTTGQTAEGIEVSFYAMMPDPSTGWTAQSALREQLLAYIRDEHSDWLPRDRVQETDGTQSGAALGSAASS